MKTQDLTGPALDWAVAKCIVGNEMSRLKVFSAGNGKHWIRLLVDGGNPYGPGLGTDFSTDWAQGGPIIEREKIETYFQPAIEQWAARHDDNLRYGPTPLIAAMRCYVVSKLGNEVEVPEELK